MSSPLRPTDDMTSAPCPADHVIPGGHEHEGIRYTRATPPDTLRQVQDFIYRDDDVVLITYPKSGTHWMQTIIELIRQKGGVSPVPASPEAPPNRAMFIEFNRPPDFKTPCMDLISNMPSPRFYMSHLQVQFFSDVLQNKKTKFIIVMRNIKDTLVSYYHFYRSNGGLGLFKGTFPEFMEIFKAKRLVYGDWFDFTLGWWVHKDNPNCTFFMYEDMKQDPEAQIKRVAEALGVELKPEELTQIREESSFDVMKAEFEKPGGPRRGPPVDNKISPLLRKGQVGDWMNHFTPELTEYIDELYEENMSRLGSSRPIFTTNM